jgi:LITAF-like zinc ribbon domain
MWQHVFRAVKRTRFRCLTDAPLLVIVPDLLYKGVYYPSPQPGIVVTQPVVTVVSMQYGESPIATTCPHCHQSIVTAVTFEIGGLAWLICAILCLLG